MTHLAYIVFSILIIIGNFTLSPSFWNFTTPIPSQTVFFACTAAINVLLTGLIVGKIVFHTRWISESLGNKNLRWYNIAVSTMIESSVLFSKCAIATAASFSNLSVLDNANNIIINVTSQMTVSWRLVHDRHLDVTDSSQSIAPTLIAYRVANGISFTFHNSNLTPIAFATPSGPPNSTQIISTRSIARDQMMSMSVDMDERHRSVLEEGHVREDKV